MQKDNHKKTFLDKVIGFVINSLLLLAIAYFFMLMWNTFMPGISGFEAINYSKAIAISICMWVVEKFL